MAISTARLLRTGRVPGRPRQTGQTLVFGGSPKRVEQPQKILVRVRSWTWTSRPITGSYFARTSGAREGSSGVDFAITEGRLEHQLAVRTGSRNAGKKCSARAKPPKRRAA